MDANALADLIVQKEMPKLQKIMKYVGDKIQGDVVAVTYNVIDAFYSDYTRPPRGYIRTDEYKARHRIDASGRKHGKKGYLIKKTSSAEKKRASDKSLISTIKNLKSSGQPAIGVSRPLDGVFGYQAGVIFDEGYFNNESGMKHSVKGSNFTEWDIVEDFLWGVHGNESIKTTTPSAGLILYDYINSYKSRFDKHYNDALRKFK